MVDIQDEIDAFWEVLTEIAEYLAEIADELESIRKAAGNGDVVAAPFQLDLGQGVLGFAVELIYGACFVRPAPPSTYAPDQNLFPGGADPDPTFGGPV